MCDKSRDAGTVDLPLAQLISMQLEHSDYWDGTYEALGLEPG